MIRNLLFAGLFLLQWSCINAQSEPERKMVFDAFQFEMPEGFSPVYEGPALTLNSDPSIFSCSFVLIQTLGGSDNPEINFEDSWNALIVPALANGSSERKTWKDDRNRWKGYAGSTTVMSDTLKLQFELHTYTRNDRHVSAMFFFEPEKCKKEYELFLQTLALADDASENGPPARDYYVTSDPAFLSQEKLTGVWTLEHNDSADYFTYFEKENFITFLDNGDFYNGLLPYGSFHTDRENLKNDNALKTLWGNYKIEGNSGSITLPSDREQVPVTLLNNTLITVGEERYIKSRSVSGYRLEGVWSAEFSGIVSRLELNLAGRFIDSGIFKSFHDVRPWLFADENGGEGIYQIYDHTVYLKYDDGRERALSFVNPGNFDLRETNSLVLIAGNPFKKIPGEIVTY